MFYPSADLRPCPAGTPSLDREGTVYLGSDAVLRPVAFGARPADGGTGPAPAAPHWLLELLDEEDETVCVVIAGGLQE